MLTLTGKRVMVTGGAGFIGSHLVDRLVREAPASVVVVDNLFLGNLSHLDGATRICSDLHVHTEDVSDYEVMKEIVVSEQVQVVFNLAVVPLPTSLERPRWSSNMNFVMTSVMCELLREGLFETLIHFSSSEVYGSARYVPMDEDHPLAPCTPYAASKAAGDHLVSSYRNSFGVDASIVRPFNGFGPRQNEKAYAGILPTIIRRVLAGETVEIYGDGEQTRDFTYVSDIAEAAVRVFQHPATRGQVVNVSSGSEVSVNVLVGELLEVLGEEVPLVRRPKRPGDVRRHLGSSALCERLTGFRPRGSMREGLVETVRWYRELLSAPEGAHAG